MEKGMAFFRERLLVQDSQNELISFFPDDNVSDHGTISKADLLGKKIFQFKMIVTKNTALDKVHKKVRFFQKCIVHQIKPYIFFNWFLKTFRVLIYFFFEVWS